jgi:DNA polymerase-3 subunit chi
VTEIDFYIHVEDRLRVTCQLVHKARARDLRVLILLPDEASMSALDERLWTYQPQAFVPHCRASEPHAWQTPVLLACDEITPPHDQLLVNLRAEPPQHFARFSRLIEIVSLDEADRAQARARFRFYRDGGYTLRTHPLGQAATDAPPPPPGALRVTGEESGP